MKIRSVIASVLVVAGFLLIMGAVGSNECGFIGLQETLIRAAIGMLLMGIAAPVNGSLNDDEKNRR